MVKRSFYLALLFALFLSSCGGQTTATPGQTPTHNPTAMPATKVPPTTTAQPGSVTSTTAPTTIPATNSPNCVNQAAFVADVTVPDNTKFDANAKFTKTWRVKNTGTCTWNSKYTLVFVSGYSMNAPAFVSLSNTAPGQTLDISADLVAPDKRGTDSAFFAIHDPNGDGIPIDNGWYLYVTIFINSSVAGGATPTKSSAGNNGSSTTTVAGGACAYSVDPVKVADVITALNSYRAQNGLAPLVVNPLLTQAAQAHSADMACKNLFTHAGSDGSTIASRIAAAGYKASGSTENVYGSFPPITGQGVVSWWATDKTDPSHNANLLTTKYSEIGVSYSFFNNFGYYVIDFASP